MSKIICDICGTSYQDSENECPICGCAKDFSVGILTEELLEQEPVIPVSNTVKAESKKSQTPSFADFDELYEAEDDFDNDDYDDDDYDEYEDEDDEDDEEDDDEDDEDEHPSNAPLIVALVLVILALLAVGAFILVKFFLPNVVAPEATKPSIAETTTAPVETTQLGIPCESLALTSGGEIVLDTEGANWLINVMALPENTTDELVYVSSDEAVVTVDEQGKLTAVGEGTAVITIICGQQELKCTVNCAFVQETTVPETTVPETTVPEDVDETEPQQTEAPKEVTGTITASTLNIRATPDTNGNVVGLYAKGQKVVILERKTVGNTEWGRTDKGWISMKFVELDN